MQPVQQVSPFVIPRRETTAPPREAANKTQAGKSQPKVINPDPSTLFAAAANEQTAGISIQQTVQRIQDFVRLLSGETNRAPTQEKTAEALGAGLIGNNAKPNPFKLGDKPSRNPAGSSAESEREKLFETSLFATDETT